MLFYNLLWIEVFLQQIGMEELAALIIVNG